MMLRYMHILPLLLVLTLLPVGCAGGPLPTSTPTPTPVPCDGELLPFVTLARGQAVGCPPDNLLLCTDRTLVEAVTDSRRWASVLDAVAAEEGADPEARTPVATLDLSRSTILVVVEITPSPVLDPLRVVSICQRSDGLTLMATGESRVGPFTPAVAAMANPYHVLVVDNDTLLYHGRTPVRLERTDGSLLYSGYVDLPNG